MRWKISSHKRTVRVVRSYSPANTSAVEFLQGEVVEVGESSEEWPGWVYITKPSGEGGWVLKKWIRQTGAKGRILTACTTAEHSVKPGETLTVQLEACGWALTWNSKGLKGWVPLFCVEELADEE